MRKFLFVCLFFLPFGLSRTQIPIGAVADVPLAATNTVTMISEQLHRLLLEDEEGFTSIISDVQAFFDKARNKVNHAIQNMQTVRAIVDIQADIQELLTQSIENINAPRDENPEVSGQVFDGLDDLHFLNKWQQIQILLALSAEASSVFELFQSLIEDDSLRIDDKGRVVLIQQVYKDLLRIRSAMRTHIRRINRQIFTYSKTKREILAFEALFNPEQ